MHLPGGMRDALQNYCLALALVGGALLLRALLPMEEGVAIFQLPIAAVVLSAWYGGLGPGFIASLTSVLGVLYFFVPPLHTFKVSPDDALAFVIFVAVTLFLSEFSAGRRRTAQALRTSEERFRNVEAELRARQEMLDLAQRAARAVAFDWFIGARESENRWSPELEMMHGVERGTFDSTFEGWKKLINPDDWPAVKLVIQRAHESGDIASE